MRLSILLLLFLNLSIAKDIRYKIQSSNQVQHNYISVSGASLNNQADIQNNRNMRDDTSTVWLQDFEGDLSDWTVEAGWELTEESSYSPTHSFHVDDDNLDALRSNIATSPRFFITIDAKIPAQNGKLVG